MDDATTTVDPGALAVLGRTVDWLRRFAGEARYVEATYGVWAARLGDAGVSEALSGFDADDASGRAARTARLLEALGRLGPAAAPAPSEPRVVLLPEGIASEVPPKAPPPAPPKAEPVVVDPLAVVGEVVAREERPPREERRPREERPPREERAPREDRPPREERAPRQERQDRQDRRDRDRSGDRRSEPVAAPAPAAEPPRPPPPPKVEEPPPPRTFPLGHPEGTGVGVESLGVFDATELEALAAEGVETVADLLTRPPLSVERAGERLVDGVPPEGPVLLRGKVVGRYTRISPIAHVFELRLKHDRGVIACRWLGEVPPEARAARVGTEIGLAGRVDGEDDARVLYEAEPLGIDGRGGDWFPVYAVPGVADARMRAGVREALRRHDGQLQDHLPPEVVEKLKLMPLPATIRDVHFPPNASRKGRARMAFDELLQIQLGFALLRTRTGKERGIAHEVSHALVTQAFSTLGWYFNDPQEAAFDAIRRDMRRSQPMERLLQGDVGSGKLGVVRAAMLLTVQNRQQVLFCAHDATSAENHWLFAQEWFRAAGVEPLLLTGTPTRTQQEALRKGETQVIFGTQALLTQPPEFKRVGLVVVEQQTTHGVPELTAFESQGARPHLLVVTPTPVPALLTLTAYGQLAMTVIDSAAAHGVDVTILPTSERERAYVAAREAIARGEQVILAFPLGRGQDLLSAWEARKLGEALAAEALPGARFVLFNSGITREERFRAYDDFQHRRADVLLATTAIEDGPIVPNASVLIVEQADRLDLVRAHRLRRHIAAGYRRAACFFITGEEPEAAGMAALELVAKEPDGFRIADLDLARRGAAEVLGEATDDVPRFAWADPAHDRDTLARARTEAFRLLSMDPGLKRRVHRGLLNLVRMRFGEDAFAEGATAESTPTGAAGAASTNRRRRRRRRG